LFFQTPTYQWKIGIGKITWERAIVDLEECCNNSNGVLKTINWLCKWMGEQGTMGLLIFQRHAWWTQCVEAAHGGFVMSSRR
jgi:hypothetical protein